MVVVGTTSEPFSCEAGPTKKFAGTAAPLANPPLKPKPQPAKAKPPKQLLSWRRLSVKATPPGGVDQQPVERPAKAATDRAEELGSVAIKAAEAIEPIAKRVAEQGDIAERAGHVGETPKLAPGKAATAGSTGFTVTKPLKLLKPPKRRCCRCGGGRCRRTEHRLRYR